MTTDKSFVRFPWVAVALSFLASGVGHIYCCQIVKGLFMFSARFLLPLLCILAAFFQPSNGVLLGLILLPALAMLGIFLYSPIDAFLAAKKSAPDYKKKEYNRSGLYLVLIAMQLACPISLIWGTQEYVYEAFLIPTRSMSPNILPNDRILVNKRPFQEDLPQRGDVVVYRNPSSEKRQFWVDRVIGVAGDRIVINGQEIEVNGKKIEREQAPAESTPDIDKPNIDKPRAGRVHYETHAGRRYRVLLGDNASQAVVEQIDVTVPSRSVYVLGDNRDRSRDSRSIGPIHVGDLVGYVEYNYFPAKTWTRFGAFRD